ncbi:hypothetical protein ABMA79_05060 [Halobacteriovorax sp. HFRX-2_2]|uniref:hypothetical protein n=1 Tax=unclassified Halobacteriovorax TaxID=2639665 RepID=UPI00371F7224
MKNSLLLLISLVFTSNTSFASYDGYDDYYGEDINTVVETITSCHYGNFNKKLVVKKVYSDVSGEALFNEISIDGKALEKIDYKFESKNFVDPLTNLTKTGYLLELSHQSVDNSSTLSLIASSLDAHLYNPDWESYDLRGTLKISSIYNKETTYVTRCSIESEVRYGTPEEIDVLFENFDYDSYNDRR